MTNGQTTNNKKKSKKTNKGKNSNNFYLYYFHYIKLHSKLPSKKESGHTKQQMNYYIRELKARGLIEKKGYGVWKTLKENYDGEKVKKVKIQSNSTPIHVATQKHKIRSHAFQFKLHLKPIPNWKNRLQFFKKKKYKHSIVYGKNPALSINGFTIHLNNESLVFYAESGTSFFSESARSGKIAGINACIQTIKKLETMMSISFKIRGKYKLTTLKQEYAEIENELAKEYNLKKEKFAVYGDDGKKWLLIDDSFSLKELETVHNEKADKDMDNTIKPFFNSIRNKKGFTADFIIDGLTKSGNNVDKLMKTVETLALSQFNNSTKLDNSFTEIAKIAMHALTGVQLLDKQNKNLIKELEILSKNVTVLVQSMQMMNTNSTSNEPQEIDPKNRPNYFG